MKMKIARGILNLCFVALAVSACEESEMENSRVPIRFAASADEVKVDEIKNTRAGGAVPGMLPVRVVADMKDKQVTLFGSEYETAATKTWTFMDGWSAVVKESGSNYVFDYATSNEMKYYSPKGGVTYDFKAVYPSISAGGNTGVSLSSSGFPVVDLNLERFPDLMLAEIGGVTKPNGQTSLSLQFKHQLVLVTFNIRKVLGTGQQEDDESHNVYLNKILLKGRTTGSFNMQSKQLAPVSTKTEFTVADLGSPFSTLLVGKVPQTACSVFLFPADGDIAAQQYTFTFVINSIENNITLPASGKKWEVGMEYIYNLKVVGSDVYLEVNGDSSTQLDQEKWEDLDGSDDIIEGV